jgi:hypothetical protein
MAPATALSLGFDRQLPTWCTNTSSSTSPGPATRRILRQTRVDRAGRSFTNSCAAKSKRRWPLRAWRTCNSHPHRSPTLDDARKRANAISDVVMVRLGKHLGLRSPRPHVEVKRVLQHQRPAGRLQQPYRGNAYGMANTILIRPPAAQQ